MQREQPTAVADVLVKYTAPQMPTPVIERIQAETVRDLNQGEIDVRDAFQIVNLLLTIALMKLADPDAAR